ncbi:MAG: crossover junction endodeoxyribonuclease RuvC [Candidatus Pacebacteria bacterium]|nr:crossover junction endodeoxyribonuclease RuvC [Candidatus Paceibacterota bacterium]
MKISKHSPKTILGIDPGYERLGVAIIENTQKPSLIFSDCIRSKKGDEFIERLFSITTELEKIIEKFKPELISIENLFVVKNQKTAMAVSEVRGVIKYLARKNNIPIVEMTPPEIKLSITGYGHASKDAIYKMISKIFVLPKKGILDDEIDAMAIAIAGSFKKI